MEYRNNKKLYVSTIIILCHIIDNYEEFINNLLKVLPKKEILNDLLNISRLSKGENIFGAKNIKKFYKENIDAIDIINSNGNIFVFLCDLLDRNGNIKNIDLLYNYLIPI